MASLSEATKHLRHWLMLSALGMIPAASAAPAAGPTNDGAGAAKAAAQCMAFGARDLSGIEDAEITVLSAGVERYGERPDGFCRVTGRIAPEVGFELWLPLEGWNGKMVQIACGGFCGTVSSDVKWGACGSALDKGFACIGTDGGHFTGNDYSLAYKWAERNLQAQVDYNFRANHVTAIAGKALTTLYYDRGPRRAYLMGCSGGGRNGLVAAQRFPWDFDGIVAGAPSISGNGSVLRLMSVSLNVFGTGEQPVLGKPELALLHGAAVKTCDRDDGVADGIIGNPPACRFDPAKLLCGPGQSRSCLSQTQVDAARRIYAGPASNPAEALYTGGNVPGSEIEWGGPTPKDWQGFFQHIYFDPPPGQSWTPSQFDFSRAYRRLGSWEAQFTAIDPDLRRFKANGGKLILWHGWSDAYQTGTNFVEYYNTVERLMGSRSETQNFFRLFLQPGVNHCSGGAGADVVDYLAYIDDWVEHDRAPDMVLSTRLTDEARQAAGYSAPRFPLDHRNVAFTRPVYPYPLRARYKGAGDPNDAANFGPAPQ